jgi:primosomal protein N' (replication factor Y)
MTPTARPISVAVDLPLRTGDAAFTFAAGAAADAPAGAGVIVPIGRRLVPGVVLGDAPSRDGLRPVVARLAGGPLIPPDLLDLIQWTAAEYVSSVGEALAVAVPWAALWARVRVGAAAGEESVDAPYRDIVAAFRRRPATPARAARLLAAVPDAATVLAERGCLSVILHHGDDRADGEAPVGARGTSSIAASQRTVARWSAALASAVHDTPRSVVLAGWDRTAAYRDAITDAHRRGWSCIVACATVEVAAALASTLRAAGLTPTLLHGEQRPEARLAAWRRLIGQSRAVVVGTRSAIFAPVAGPVLAIVDDDDHSGHKEERAPRYVTAVIAANRTREAGATILGTATPSVAAFVRVRDGASALVSIPSPRPQIGIIDTRRRADPDAAISVPIVDLVGRAVRGGGRVLILTDRKGYAGSLHCAECGAVPRCARCGVAMGYERAARRLRCRSCGITQPAPAACARCGGPRLRAIGAGTERVAAAARRLTSAVWRLDSDTVVTHADLDAPFRAYRARGGIVVSTIIVLPYLAALNPTLVAVVGADRWLHRPEYRATERALALFRTLGMATRRRVLVETSDPTHPVLEAMSASLRPWYEAEAALRESLGYPPFRVVAAVTIAGTNEDGINRVIESIRQEAPASVEVLGAGSVQVYPRRAGGRAGEHRAGGGGGVAQRLVVKAPTRNAVRALLWPYIAGTSAGARRVRVAVDVEPLDLA